MQGHMGYVDRAYLDDDESGMLIVHNRAPVKEIALAVTLLMLGALGIIIGLVMMYNKAGGDRANGIAMTCLGAILFLPGFYETRIAYYAWKGYKGFSFANIPAV
eukprot:TRINITY_DN16056_c0_g1_i1.p1 TRINITY_DN16056_c0_g1~~TRINITY_DN16056_c0_g1_i1.p1  ORF type:complete len:104 (-),score=11.47 TRINITY_DN16056_c0_g1_i1:570-881(-)